MGSLRRGHERCQHGLGQNVPSRRAPTEFPSPKARRCAALPHRAAVGGVCAWGAPGLREAQGRRPTGCLLTAPSTLEQRHLTHLESFLGRRGVLQAQACCFSSRALWWDRWGLATPTGMQLGYECRAASCQLLLQPGEVTGRVGFLLPSQTEQAGNTTVCRHTTREVPAAERQRPPGCWDGQSWTLDGAF